jgi:cell division protein FtsI/penicillin-binding protein 2
VRATLAAHRGHPGRNLHTTLDLKVQRAAEAALGGLRQNAALVAVQPSTGDILGVAQRPQDSTYDRALTGLYPPGSTFKVVSTATLLRSGLTVSQPVECTPTITVSGKSFHNFEGEASGAVPFHTDFAQSCNTAFISLAGRLSRNDLTQVGREFGLGRPLHLGLPAADSKVPPATDAVSQAAMMIGQDRIVVSPLAMAGVAATVAAGRWRSPRLLPSDPRSTADPLPTATVTTLRSLMREVVTNGTGMALAGVPGEPAGKTGTAEFGGGDPPPTHAWFVAYRGDLALAVLVERGSSGGAVAAPIAARFFNALDRP